MARQDMDRDVTAHGLTVAACRLKAKLKVHREKGA